MLWDDDVRQSKYTNFEEITCDVRTGDIDRISSGILCWKSFYGVTMFHIFFTFLTTVIKEINKRMVAWTEMLPCLELRTLGTSEIKVFNVKSSEVVNQLMQKKFIFAKKCELATKILKFD